MLKNLFLFTILAVWTMTGQAIPLSGLVSAYNANGNALDSVGNSHGSLVGNVSYVAGREGQAFYFPSNPGPGLADTVSGTVGGNWPLGNAPRTISAWVKTTGTYSSLGEIIFHYGDVNAGPSFHLLLYMGVAIFSVGSGGGGVSGSTTVTDGNWHHILGTLASNGDAKLYVDGVLEGSSNFTSVNTPTGIFTIGSALNRDPQNDFYGAIDQVLLYNRALNASEVSELAGVPEPGVWVCCLIGSAFLFFFKHR